MLALMVFSLGLSLPWLYVGGAGEPDSNAMLVGIYQGVLQKTWFGGSLYMLQGQPLYYVIGLLIQRLFRFSFDHLALAMNLMAAVLSAGTAVLLYGVLRSFVGPAVAFGAAVLTLSSATIFEWSTYTHPVTLSHFLFFASLFALMGAITRGAGMRRWVGPVVGWYCASILLGMAAVAARADIVVLFHLYVLVPLLWLLYGQGEPGVAGMRWHVVIGGAMTGFLSAGGGLFALNALTAGHGGDADAGPAGGLVQAYIKYFRLIPPVDGFFEVVFGFGVAGSLLFFGAVVGCLVRRNWLSIVMALVVVLPPTVYAMSQVQPARRWFPVIYVMAFAVTVLCANITARRVRRFIAVYGIAGVIINLYLLPMAGDVLRGRGVKVDDHTLLYRATADVFRHHRINQQYLARVFSQMRNIRETAPRGSLLVGSFADVSFLMATYCKDGLPTTTTLVQRADYSVMTRVTGGGDVFYVAEVHSVSLPPPLEISPPAIYQFNPWMPPGWGSQSPTVISLAPSRAERYAMWLRRP